MFVDVSSTTVAVLRPPAPSTVLAKVLDKVERVRSDGLEEEGLLERSRVADHLMPLAVHTLNVDQNLLRWECQEYGFC